MNNKTALIISGGSVVKDFLVKVFHSYCPEIVIAADRGLLVANELKIPVTHIVGDFDSAGSNILKNYDRNTKVEIRKFRPEKDYTDTEIALDLAIELGVKTVLMIGCTGTRLDHVLGNIQILSIAKEAGVKAYIMDSHNCISLIERETTLIKSEQFGNYISLFPLGGKVEGLTLKGFKYELKDHVLEPINSLCVSNEIVKDTATITYKSGCLIMMETKD